VPVLAELVDAVVGVDTHRDTHTVEIALPTGTPIATRSISNDSTGYAELLAWILDHAPGPRLVVAIEGTRSYGLGLARAVAPAGVLVLECERPNRNARRGTGKSDPIDAHLAVLTALRLDADRIPTPRADGDREALPILLCARQELTATGTAQTNRLRALLLAGDDTDRRLTRGALTETTLAGLARRRPPRDATREQAIRQAEIRRLALALRENNRDLKTNRSQLQAMVNEIAPGLTTAAASARSAPRRSSSASSTPDAAAATPPSPRSPAPAPSRPAAAAPSGIGATEAATALSTTPSTSSP